MDKKFALKVLAKKSIFSLFFFIWALHYSIAQIPCLPAINSFNFTPTPISQNKFINWDAFPEFSLPFKIIFGGPRFGDITQQPLKHGFSHLAMYSGADSATLPVKNRALIYYGVAYNFPNPQPWQLIRSPWANDMPDYQKKWRGEMEAYAYHFEDTKGKKAPAADMLILDIERHWEGQFTLATNLAILDMKKEPLVPGNFKQMSDNQFVERYKKDMLNLYAEPLKYMKNQGLLANFNKISSYGDVPVRYQGLNIEGNDWSTWQSNAERLSYLMKDTLTNKIGGPFYNQLDFLCPSVYIQADYAANPKTRGGNYLAEMLFQIEVNKAWSQKDILPFVWLRYEDFSLPYPRFIKPFQAEASAIFPFFAGAKGAILWDDSYQTIDQTNFTTYEYYINGLYKLSLYKSFFEGNYELVQGTNARDLFANQLPVWRGVVKDGKILIAAHNPYAADNEETKVNVVYKNWRNTISLKGKEVYLCAFELTEITANEPTIEPFKVKVFSNPIQNDILKFSLLNIGNEVVATKLFSSSGQLLYEKNSSILKEDNQITISLSNLPKGIYFLHNSTKKNSAITKILK